MFKIRHYIVSITIPIIVFIGCSSTIRTSSDSVTHFVARNYFPLIDATGKVSSYDTNTIHIYCKGTMRIFALTYRFVNRTDSGVSITLNRHYAIFDRDSSWGYNVDSSRKTIKQRVSLESLFQGEWIKRNNFYSILTENKSVLLNKTTNIDSGITKELYLIKDRYTQAESGTVEIMYEHPQLAPSDVTISKQLDSLSNLKTTRIEVTIYPKFFKERNMTVSQFKMINELKQVSYNPDDKIAELFNTK